MEIKRYLDFDIRIAGSDAGYYTSVRSSAGGTAQGDFKIPFSDQQIEHFLLMLGGRRRTRRVGSPEQKNAQTFGGLLFKALFTEEIGECFQRSLDQARRNGSGLRIRLQLGGVPKLADLPWEFLYHAAPDRFLALSGATPIIRYLDFQETILPLRVEPPVRLLAMISSPPEYPELDVEKEFGNLKSALADLEKRGTLVLERLDRPTLSSLQRQLRRGEYHILHFIGHGVLDDNLQEGALLLETADGRSRLESASQVATVLHNNGQSLRLVVLNACEGARATRSDSFSGIAQTLIRQRIPAVVAMQFEISDRAAISFAQEFYTALADGFSVDLALTEARVRLFGERHELEWATPVLYTRSEDGRLFDIPAMPQLPSVPQVLPVLPDNQKRQFYRSILISLSISIACVLIVSIAYIIRPVQKGYPPSGVPPSGTYPSASAEPSTIPAVTPTPAALPTATSTAVAIIEPSSAATSGAPSATPLPATTREQSESVIEAVAESFVGSYQPQPALTKMPAYVGDSTTELLEKGLKVTLDKATKSFFIKIPDSVSYELELQVGKWKDRWASFVPASKEQMSASINDSGFADGEWSGGWPDSDTKAVFWNVPITLVDASHGDWAMVELGVFTGSESVGANGKKFIRITWPSYGLNQNEAVAVFLKK